MGQPRVFCSSLGICLSHASYLYLQTALVRVQLQMLSSHSLPPCAILHLLIKYENWGAGGLLLRGIPLQYSKRAPIFGFQTWCRGGNPTPWGFVACLVVTTS